MQKNWSNVDDGEFLPPLKRRESFANYLENAKLLITIVLLKDPHHCHHAEQVQALSVAIGQQMHLSERQLSELSYAALLHDAGKAFLPASLLGTTQPLSREQWNLIRLHPVLAYELLYLFAPSIADAILHHHENYDGTGYPDGLSGDAIPAFSRIIRVADSVSAAISERSYKKPKSLDQIISELHDQAGTIYDPVVVQAFDTLRERAQREHKPFPQNTFTPSQAFL